MNRPASIVFAATAVVSAAGTGCAALHQVLQSHRHALVPNTFSSRPFNTVVGAVQGVDAVRLPSTLQGLDCRNHRLAWMGLQADGFDAVVAQCVKQVGPQRVGVVMGTSTSSMGATEAAYRQGAQAAASPSLYQLHALGQFVTQALAITGPAVTVSTACSSSAKALGIAQRWLHQGVVDAVVVGGVDSLCDSVLFGFDALQLVATGPCTPFDVDRRGINLGEAAAFALMLRADDAGLETSTQPRLLAVGESSDAHHMSAPQPEGRSIEAAVRSALQQAGVVAEQVDYVNLHGTATPQNDAVEAAMLARVYPPSIHASSTKGFIGHTLGASGLVEALVCLLAMAHDLKPGTVNTSQLAEGFAPRVRLTPQAGRVRVAVSHAFGFGGTNAALVLARRR